jgi:outer membrane lipoprotein carrier protein
MRLLALTLLFTLCAAAQASGLERFQSFVKTTQSARGEFEQKVFDKNRKLVQQAKGTFAFQRPDRFRWSYAAPASQLVVGDGQRLWIYDEDLNQVSVRRISRAMGATPAVLLAGNADIEKLFEISEGSPQDGLEWLDAKPREKEAGFERVRIGFGLAGIEAMELVDSFGQTTQLRFSKLQRNPSLDPATFRFTPPKGADVVGDK